MSFVKSVAVASLSLTFLMSACAFHGSDHPSYVPSMDLVLCRGDVDENSCLNAFVARSDIDAEVGLPVGWFATYQNVMVAEYGGTVLANAENANACLLAIDSLSCESSEVEDAYRSDQVDPYAFATGLFGASCAHVLSLREDQ